MEVGKCLHISGVGDKCAGGAGWGADVTSQNHTQL